MPVQGLSIGSAIHRLSSDVFFLDGAVSEPGLHVSHVHPAMQQGVHVLRLNITTAARKLQAGTGLVIFNSALLSKGVAGGAVSRAWLQGADFHPAESSGGTQACSLSNLQAWNSTLACSLPKPDLARTHIVGGHIVPQWSEDWTPYYE